MTPGASRAPAPWVPRSLQAAWRAGALAFAAWPLFGCATAVLGVHESFQIVSSPPAASVQLSTGETCVTPCTLQLPRAVAFKARVSLPGYATQVLPVVPRLGAVGAVGFLGNGMIGGVVGAGEDLESGAMRSLSPNPLKVRLIPLSPPAR